MVLKIDEYDEQEITNFFEYLKRVRDRSRLRLKLVETGNGNKDIKKILNKLFDEAKSGEFCRDTLYSLEYIMLIITKDMGFGRTQSIHDFVNKTLPGYIKKYLSNKNNIY